MLIHQGWIAGAFAGMAISCLPAHGMATDQPVDWNRPETIDLAATGIGNFLDVDLSEYSRLANTAYQAQDYRTAARYFLAMVRSDVHDVGSIYDIACCYGWLEEPELAAQFLSQAVSHGFESLERIQQEPAFDSVRETEVFAAALESIEAQLAQSRATKRFYYATARYDEYDPEAIYELACCYGVRDDARMAAEYLLQAITAGFRDRQAIAENPDFDTVRADAEFIQAIKALEDIAAPVAEEPDAIPPEIVYADAGVSLPCLVQFPADYDPERAYPLVIGLHGYGSNVERFASNWFAFDNPQFIYAVPQAPYLVPQPDYLGYSWWIWDLENKPLWDKSLQRANEYTLAITDQLTASYNISETYLFGFSQGCALTYLAGINNSGRYTGIICFCGWLDEGWFTPEALARAKNLRVFIAHATDDQSMMAKAGRDTRDRLQELDYDVTYREFTGGHTLPAEELRVVADWVIAPPGV